MKFILIPVVAYLLVAMEVGADATTGAKLNEGLENGFEEGLEAQAKSAEKAEEVLAANAVARVIEEAEKQAKAEEGEDNVYGALDRTLNITWTEYETSPQLIFDDNYEVMKKEDLKPLEDVSKIVLEKKWGHFSETILFETYLDKLGEIDKENPDNINNYRPTPLKCTAFFTSFKQAKYKLSSVAEFIMLDACLGFLYQPVQEHNKEESPEEKNAKKERAKFINDENLSFLFHHTKIRQDEEAMICVQNMLFQAVVVLVNAKFECNDKILQFYIQFAACSTNLKDWHKKVKCENNDECDSYLMFTHRLVRKVARTCLDSLHVNLNSDMRKTFVWEVPQRIKSFLPKILNIKTSPIEKRWWSSGIKEVLNAFANTHDDRINLRYIHTLMRHLQAKDPQSIRKVIKNLSAYAERLNGLFPKIKTGDAADKAYQKKIKDICQDFRPSTTNKDLATSMIRMIRVAKYEDFFGIGEGRIVKELMTNAPTAGYYMSFCACNIFGYTKASLKKGQVRKQIVVTFNDEFESAKLLPLLKYV